MTSSLFSQVSLPQLLGGLAPSQELAGVTALVEEILVEDIGETEASQFLAEARELRRLLDGSELLERVLKQQTRAEQALLAISSEKRDRAQTGAQQRAADLFSTHQRRQLSEAVGRTLDSAVVNGRRTVEALSELVWIPSVSDLEGMSDGRVANVIDEVVGMLPDNFDAQVLCAKAANPLLYAERIVDPAKPTVVIYAHADVQPVKDREWEGGPFSIFYRGGRLFGRGTADNKSGIVSAIAAVEAFDRAEVELPVNVVLIVEGEEEIGSPHLGVYLAQIQQWLAAKGLKADVLVVTDGVNVDTHVPTIAVSARGLTHFSVRVQTAGGGVHPGVNSHVPSAFQAWSVLEYELLRNQGREFALSGLKRLAPAIPPGLVNSIASSGLESEPILRASGRMLEGVLFVIDPSHHPLAALGRDFSVTTMGLKEVAEGEPAVGVIPHLVNGTLQLRIPPGVDASQAAALFGDFLNKARPLGAHVTAQQVGPVVSPWDFGPLDHPHLQMMGAALATGYGRQSVLLPMGGSNGFLAPFSQMFPQTPLLTIGLSDPAANIHGSNESLDVRDLISQTQAIIAFLSMMGEI